MDSDCCGFISKVLMTIFTLVILMILMYRRKIYFIFKMLPRDLKFIYRGVIAMHRAKKWERNNETVVSLFTKCASQYPNFTCFIHEDKKWTYSEVESYSNKIAQVFWNAGYRDNDIVCLFMPNCVEYVCIWLGLAKIGVITALINTSLRNKPLEHCIKISNAKAIIFDKTLSESVSEVEESLGNMEFFSFGDIISLHQNSVKSLLPLLHKASLNMPQIDKIPSFKHDLFYIYTSGTTGLPKAAIIKHSRFLLVEIVVFNMFALRSTFNNKNGDVIYNSLPMYHLSGGAVGTGPALIDGVPVVIRKKFSASNFWKDCIKYKCTVAQYIGEICRYLLTQPYCVEETQHSVRKMIGNGLKSTVWKKFVDRFEISMINEIYGATEGNSNVLNIEGNIGSVGFLPLIVPTKLSPIALIKVDETDTPIRGPDGFCIRCKENEPGMIVGRIVEGNITQDFQGYLNKEENKKKILTDVFSKGDKMFLSGDILMMDEMGYIYFKDRIGDTFKWKGENVSTTEVEGIISDLISNKACTVYGVPIPAAEGRAGMLVVANESFETLDLEKLSGNMNRVLPSYSHPIFIRFTKDLEMTDTFKLKKINYVKEGFNPEMTSDLIYFRYKNEWVKMTSELYRDICEGKVKL